MTKHKALLQTLLVFFCVCDFVPSSVGSFYLLEPSRAYNRATIACHNDFRCVLIKVVIPLLLGFKVSNLQALLAYFLNCCC